MWCPSSTPVLNTRGTTFLSLTAIAVEITGAHWSGPRFFGLLRRRGAKEAGAGGGGETDGETNEAGAKLAARPNAGGHPPAGQWRDDAHELGLGSMPCDCGEEGADA